MLFYLFSPEELRALFDRLGYPFRTDTISRNVEYYSRRTAHGSSLSRVVHAWVQTRSDPALAWELFKDALGVDVSDLQAGTTAEGIHTGAMSGTVDLMQRAYTGWESRDGTLSFNPCLPPKVEALHLRVRYRGHSLDVAVTQDALQLASRPGGAAPIQVSIKNQSHTLAPGHTIKTIL